MCKYYLRVEAVNLANSIYDTSDISTIRGGSFMLLDAVNAIEEPGKIEKKSIGASSGLFELPQASSKEEAEAVCQAVRKTLAEKGKKATFVVDFIESADSNAQAVIKELMAKNRWSQFQQATIIPPPEKIKLLSEMKDAEPEAYKGEHVLKPCEKDGLYPGNVHAFKPGPGDERMWISERTYHRREFGKKLREGELFRKIALPALSHFNNIPDFYKKFSRMNDNSVQFTRDLENLCQDPEKGALNGKIAFLYLDGNQFGDIRNTKCKIFDTLNNFDETVQFKLRGKALLEILLAAMDDQDFKTENGQIRLETLLWGGDEIEWVVPAWKGLEVAQTFFAQSATFEGQDLTHCMGIVFCHHNAPIREIRKLAHHLADYVKADLKKNSDPPTKENGNLIQYVVLESFDAIQQDLDVFANQYYNLNCLNPLRINADKELNTLVTQLKTITRSFPHNKIYEITKLLKINNDYDSKEVKEGLEGILKRAYTEISLEKETLEAALQVIGVEENPSKWFLIADLWDYVKYQKEGGGR